MKRSKACRASKGRGCVATKERHQQPRDSKGRFSKGLFTKRRKK